MTKGYLIPDPVDPGEYRCIKVYVPNDDIYLSAFLGSYYFFSTWVAWEKTGDGKGSQAASVWRVAYEMTRDELGNECIDMETIQEIIQACCASITGGLNSIATEVSKLKSSSGPGGCCGCVPIGDKLDDDDPETYDPDVPELPEDYDDDDDPLFSYLESKCQWAHAMSDDFIKFMTRMGDAGFATAVSIGAAAVVVILSIIVPGVLVITATGILVVVSAILALGSISVFTWEIFTNISEYLTTNRDDLVCAFYQHHGTTEARDAIRAVFYDAIDYAITSFTQIERDEIRPEVVAIVNAYINNATVNLMFRKFKPGFFDLDYSGSDCSQCEDQPPTADYTFEDLFGNNDILPFTGGNGIDIHTDVFYGGDGHIKMVPTPSVNVSINATNASIVNHAGVGNPTGRILVGFEVDISHAGNHGSQPSSNSIEITFNEGQVDQTVVTIAANEITTDTYTTFYYPLDLPWNYSNPQNAVKIKSIFAGVFNAETKIGRVKFYINNV